MAVSHRRHKVNDKSVGAMDEEAGEKRDLILNGWLPIEKLQLEPQWVMLTPSHLPLWFEQEDRKVIAPQLPMARISREDTRGSDQPLEHNCWFSWDT